MKLIHLALNSLSLDLEFISKSYLPFLQKIHLVAIKYYLIFKHQFIKFELGKSNFKFNNQQIFYASPLYGIASIQSMHSIHYQFLKQANIKNPNTIIDIGASIGNFSLMARALYPKSQIIAFEPLSDSFSCLQKNFTNDQNFKAFNLALSDTKGHTNFTDSFETSAINPQGSIQINTDTLDNIIKQEKLDKIDLLKIDTETHEAHILKSASETLSRTHYLLIEIMIADNPNYTISSLLSLLYSPNFNFQLIAHHDYYLNNDPAHLTMIDCLFENIQFNDSNA